MHRLRYIKYSLVSGFLILTFLIQLVFIQDWNFVLILQALILDFAIILGIYAFRGFDNSTITSLNASFVAFFSGTLLGSLFALLVILFFRPRISHPVFLITMILAVLPFPILSSLILKRALKNFPPKKYLVVGKESEIGEILREVERASMGKIQIIGYMNPSPMALEQAITTNIFDAILVADQKLSRSVESILEKADSQGKSVEFLPLIVEQTLKRIPIELIDKFKEYYEIQFSSVRETPSKRVLDLFISIIAMIILSPVYLVIYLSILLDDGLPIVFKQIRVGLNGNNFIMHKFRSMKKDAESTGAKYATQQENNVTKIGKLMRPIRLDEIPQFYDILIGKMSFVGPRPEQPEFAKELAEVLPYYNYRHKLKPGLTGWAQTNYKYAATIEEQAKKLSYDLYYIKNRSFLLDLQIILRTFETVVFKKGAK
ncbi:exopolysaccharide biosynthesis polyprenyl glycosylphosphotransferase [Kosmotoga sp. DU53]|uniref:exopolysaccharide biosynthesis polyprenyl glycosylphosphotransferase n=1 Tax=Kosmotoga sp. DU53 TaxID=1310160 RepID=UPI0007D87E09|nr:exopolysaccharide biosynthesis polyprenyl glycosylphosphotransferase [Kosmotoga sp. DU53]OAA20668.1 exopolysaccharide biosynthesis polyprenyl glycosylphosphotransferase [Kosmotoga sp. DU53]